MEIVRLSFYQHDQRTEHPRRCSTISKSAIWNSFPRKEVAFRKLVTIIAIAYFYTLERQFWKHTIWQLGRILLQE